MRFRQLLKVLVHNIAPKMAVQKAASARYHAEPELDLLPELVDPNRGAIDVGGNMGTYTQRLVGLAKQVLVFEAHPRLARVLSRTFPKAEVRNEAASDQHGQVTLSIPRRDGFSLEGLGSLESGVTGTDVETYSVPSCTLDDYSDRDVGFVKIDVEGHELSVLKGAERLIKLQRPVFLIEVEERHKEGSIEAVFDLLKSAGYTSIFVFGKDVLPGEQFALYMQDPDNMNGYTRPDGVFANNFIFIPTEKWTPEKYDRIVKLRRETAPATAPDSSALLRVS